MKTRLALTHRAFFRFEKPRSLGTVALRLLPEASDAVHSSALDIKPNPGRLLHSKDARGNRLVLASFHGRLPELQTSVDLILEPGDAVPPGAGPGAGPDPFARLFEEERCFPVAQDHAILAYDSLRAQEATTRKAIANLAASLGEPASMDGAGVLNCARQAQAALRPIHPVNASFRDPGSVLRAGTASSAETAHVCSLLLQHVGFASRLATGYFLGSSRNRESSESIAEWRSWVQVFHPILGWVGMDPRDLRWTGSDYVVIAVGADPSETLPFLAELTGEGVDFSEYLDARWLRESGSIPNDELERTLMVAEHEADRRLRRAGVRLQTASTLSLSVRKEHVTIDERGIPSGPIVDTLRRSSPGSIPVTLHGQPGRIALGIACRDDGEPLWKDMALLEPTDRVASPDIARKFLEVLAPRLKIDPTFILEGYEDPLWHMMVEGELPPELEMDVSDVREGRERRRLMALLDRGLQSPSGFVLPLGFDVYSNRWNTCSWKFRRGRLYLIPGTEPMGVRMPLRSISDHFARAPVPDPFFRRPPLSDTTRALYQHEMVYTPVHQAHPIETALCVEVRQDRLHIFLPSLDRLEAWLDLLGAIEKCLARLGVSASLEAADLPLDHRLRVIRLLPSESGSAVEVELPFSAASDDGAIRAIFAHTESSTNVPRAGEAECTRHRLLLGNAVPEESPFFARPELLARFIRFWQSHPSLAVLLSVNESVVTAGIGGPAGAILRDELELGLRSLERGVKFPWDVDRALRLPLTHLPSGLFSLPWISTAEVYAPEGYRGRRGAVSMEGLAGPASYLELRLQSSLIVGILAMLSERVPERSMVAEDGIYDHAFLPFFVRREMDDVLRDLRSSEIALDAGLFDAVFHRRFPILGECHCDGIRFELQHAVEPGIAAAPRTRRMQLRVEGWFRPESRLCCNGALLPMRSTGVEGEYIAAVRFASAPADVSLQFDIFDTVNLRSSGGFQFQGGELVCGSHSVGRWKTPVWIDSATHPLTVDLRFLSLPT